MIRVDAIDTDTTSHCKVVLVTEKPLLDSTHNADIIQFDDMPKDTSIHLISYNENDSSAQDSFRIIDGKRGEQFINSITFEDKNKQHQTAETIYRTE